MLSVRLPANSRLFVVQFWGESKVTRGFSTAQGLVPLTPMAFKGQLYLTKRFGNYLFVMAIFNSVEILDSFPGTSALVIKLLPVCMKEFNPSVV